MAMTSFAADVLLALRILRARPVFAATAILTLALGIGANTAIFSLLERTLFHPLPFDDEGLVFVSLTNETRDLVFLPTNDMIAAWRQSARTVQSLEGFREDEITLTGMGAPDVTSGVHVTPGLLAALHTSPVFGRSFTDADSIPGASPVAMVSAAFANSRFGGPRNAIGKVLNLNGTNVTVVGVVPPAFDSPRMMIGGWKVWLPYHLRDSVGFSTVVGRLRRGTAVAAATADLKVTMPVSSNFKNLKVSPLLQRPTDLVRQYSGDTLLVFVGAVGLVLLIACANVANLLLARGIERGREIALRNALGAGRRRLVQQLLVESGALAVAGGALGILLAFWMLDLVLAFWPRASGDLNLRTFIGAPSPNAWVLAFSAALSIATGIICGLIPALRSTAHGVAGTLRGTAGVTPSRRDGTRVRDALVVSQVAMSVALLIAAGLLVRHMAQVSQAKLGYDPGNLLAIRPAFSGSRYANLADRTDAVRRMADIVRRSPAVVGVTVSEQSPPTTGAIFGAFAIDGRSLSAAEQPRFVASIDADPSVFTVLHLPLIEGRPYDARVSSNEVVINARMARRFWPNGTALGSRMRMTSSSPWLTVVGVAADVALPEGGVVFPEQIYRAMRPHGSPWLIVRTRRDPLEVIPVVRTAAANVDPLVPLAEVATVAALVAQRTTESRITMMLLVGFATIAIVLCGVGVYGVINFMVGQRTREIGVRMALGATQSNIQRLIGGHGAILAGVGLAIGLPGALALTRFVSHIATGINPRDPLVFTAAAGAVAVVAVLASLTPTRRAARIDPARTMREE